MAGSGEDVGDGERRNRIQSQHDSAQFTARRGCSSGVGAKQRDIPSLWSWRRCSGPGVVPATSSSVSASLFAVIPKP
jgi:hypothetical protein